MKSFLEHKGVNVTPRDGNLTHEIVRLEVQDGDRMLEIDALKSRKIVRGDFLPAGVFVRGEKKPVWLFQEVKGLGFSGLAKLFRLEAKGQSHIDLIGLVDHSNRLVSVIPLSILGNAMAVNTAEYGLIYLGGSHQPDELIRLKSRLSRQEKMTCVLTAAEQSLLKAVKNQEEAEVKEKEARILAAKQERRREIVSRENIHAFTKEGERAHGIPVVGDEWTVLPDGKSAILVESYDRETKQAGKPLEAFWVKKNSSGRVSRSDVKTGLSYERPKPEATPVSFKLFCLDGKIATVPVVAEDMLEIMREKVNSGAKVAVQEKGGEKFKIYALEKGKSRPLGVFESL